MNETEENIIEIEGFLISGREWENHVENQKRTYFNMVWHRRSENSDRNRIENECDQTAWQKLSHLKYKNFP